MGFVTTSPGRGALGPGNMLPPNLDWGDFFKFMTAPHTSWPPNPQPGQANPQPGQGSNVFKLPDQGNQTQGFPDFGQGNQSQGLQPSDPGGQSPEWAAVVNWLRKQFGLGDNASGAFGASVGGGGAGSPLSSLTTMFNNSGGIYSR